MNWMDIVAVIIIVITCFEGYFKGLVISIVSVGSFIVAGLLSIKFYPIAANLIITHTSLYSKINQAVNSKMSPVANIGISNNTFELSSIKLPKVFNDIIVTNTYTDHTVGDMIAKLMIDICSIILIFFIVKVLLFVIARILDKFMKLPVLNHLNRFGGLVFGFLKGGIIICVILAVLIPVIGMTQSQLIIKGLEFSVISAYLYDNNIILSLIKGYLYN